MAGQPVSLVKATLARLAHRGKLQDAASLLRVPAFRLAKIMRGEDVPTSMEEQVMAARLQLLTAMLRDSAQIDSRPR